MEYLAKNITWKLLEELSGQKRFPNYDIFRLKMANLNGWYFSKTQYLGRMYISNMCTNDLQKESVPNLKTVGGIIRTNSQPLCSPTFSQNH